MRIICENCSTKYSIADEKVRGKVFKIRCKKCGHIIVVKGTSDQPAAAASQFDEKETRVFDYSGFSEQAPEEGGGEEAAWHVVVEGEQVGPLTPDQVRQKFAAGEVDVESYVWKEGFADWVRLGAVEEFADLESATIAAPSPFAAGGGASAESAAPAAGGADFFAATTAESEPDAGGMESEPAPGAGADAPAGDLFGGAEPAPSAGAQAAAPAGGMAAPSAEAGGGVFGAAEPAPASSGDLFGSPSGGGSRGSLFPEEEEDEAGGGKAVMTGQRNENSVLFSLSNLQSLATGGPAPKAAPSVGLSGGGASAPAPAPAQAGAGGAKVPEGSGLLDIRAMAASTFTAGPGGEPAGAGAGGGIAVPSPFGGPMASPILMPVQQERPKWMIPALIFGAILLVAVVVLGVIVVLKKPATAPAKSSDKDKVAEASDKGEMKEEPMAATKDGMPAAGTPDMAGMTPGADTMAAPGTTPGAREDAREDSRGSRARGKRRGSRGRTSTRGRTSWRPSRTPSFAVRPTRRPSRGSDDPLAALLGRAARTSRATTRARAPRAAGPSKESLSRGDIKTGISRVKGSVRRCYDRYKVPGMIRVSITVKGSSGRVSGASVRGRFSGTPTGSCVSRAVRRAKFPKFRKSSQRFTYPFILR